MGKCQITCFFTRVVHILVSVWLCDWPVYSYQTCETMDQDAVKLSLNVVDCDKVSLKMSVGDYHNLWVFCRVLRVFVQCEPNLAKISTQCQCVWWFVKLSMRIVVTLKRPWSPRYVGNCRIIKCSCMICAKMIYNRSVLSLFWCLTFLIYGTSRTVDAAEIRETCFRSVVVVNTTVWHSTM